MTTSIEIGQIEALYRYPIKSMRGQSLDTAPLGWQGFEGDRRLALRRVDERSEFPWLTASKLPELVVFTPHRPDGDPTALPTHVRTPEGEALPVFSDELAAEISRRYGAPLQMMQLKHGIFDEATISIITSDTIREIGRLAGRAIDIRRFRPNIVVRSISNVPFEEFDWQRGTLTFGDARDAPTVAVTMRDLRCVMVNFDPDTAESAPEIMKAIVRATQNHAGIYGTVTRIGELAVGQRIVLQR